MSTEALRKNLRALLENRNTLVQCQSIQEVVKKCVEIARVRLSAQSASVFLFSKEGLLKRVGITGIDVLGESITDSWFPSEGYKIGISFTGQVAVPAPNCRYGEPQWSNNLEEGQFDKLSKEMYLAKLGKLKYAIAVPLNGQHRTYGVLQVINKLNKKGKLVEGKAFSLNDVWWLSLIGINLATTISNLRRKNELAMLAEFSEYLVEPFESEADQKVVYTRMAKSMVSPLTCYKACIIRIGRTDENIEVVAREGDGVLWDNRLDEPIKIGERIAGHVFVGGTPEFISDIEARKEEFKSIEWIRGNNLKSYACLPLAVRDKVVGTMSLFTAFNFHFYESDKNFLKNISFLIAAFTRSSGLLAEFKETDQDMSKIHSEARAVSYDQSVQKSLHSHKHELLGIQKELEKSLTLGPGRRIQIIRGQIHAIQERIKEIDTEFGESSFSRVNINHIIKSVVKSFTKEIKSNGIQVTQNLTNTVPDLLIGEENIREVIYNLVSNAIKSVQLARRSNKEILITTDVVEENQIDYVRLTVSDNGIGIRNEIAEKIYDRNFTEFPGGTGMGLWMTREILEGLGCKYRYESTVGKGTKFFVLIPRKRYGG